MNCLNMGAETESTDMQRKEKKAKKWRVTRSEKTQRRALRLRGTSVVEGGAAVKQELLKTQSSLDCGLSPAL